MSDRMYPASMETLLRWFTGGENEGQYYGLPASMVYRPSEKDPFRSRRFGQLLETPIGVAAGPHTQLAQNIASAWLMGARYIELKTVQTLDQIEVAKPCIDMEREGYNCEWSQELLLKQSAEEYLKSWVLLHALRRVLGMEGEEPGFIFNLSVGYDLAGIKNENVQKFLDVMADGSARLAPLVEETRKALPSLMNFGVPSRLSDNVTVSTMHGCPPDEIESIGRYLIEERGLHTAIKLNPTLLGSDRLRSLLAANGYAHLSVPEQAFEHDLKWDDALELIRSLRSAADKAGVQFSLKLTNTLEVNNLRKALPEEQTQLYLSGKSLHPLSVTLASQLQEQFNSELDLTFCAGADAFNTPDLLAAGLGPVTVCTDLLRPGGYSRLAQYLEVLKERMEAAGATSLEQFAQKSADAADTAKAFQKNLTGYAKTWQNPSPRKEPGRQNMPMKTARDLPRYDCALAPCVQACAIEQDIPDYLWWVEHGDLDAAWEAVLRQNPLPRITGMVCDHLCVARCTRSHYEDSILIREVKRYIAETFPGADDETGLPTPASSNGLRVAVIGAGPSGLAAAWFLALEGCEVDLYDRREMAGGMASGAIPVFRLDHEALAADIRRIEKLGVKMHLDHDVNRDLIAELHNSHDALYIAVGAQAPRKLELGGERSRGVWNQLDFLGHVRDGGRISVGKRVAVIGGGNSAVDAARTALRLAGDGGEVLLLYRRRRGEMPADPEEVEALIDEGIVLHEQVAPLKILQEDGRLTGLVCLRTRMGKPDESGRARPEPIEGSEFEVQLDTLITALGQEILLDLPFEGELTADPETMETQWAKVYAGGDAIRGASTLIRAVRDGRKASDQIVFNAGFESRIKRTLKQKNFTLEEAQQRQARKAPGVAMPHPESGPDFSLVHRTLTDEEAVAESSRCLQCNDICNLCVGVCPNRANVALPATSKSLPVYEVDMEEGEPRWTERKRIDLTQPYQIVNITDYCNECGNCVSFCPSGERPWADKPRIALSQASFAEEPDAILLRKTGVTAHGVEGGEATLDVVDGEAVFRGEGIEARFQWPEMELVSVSRANGSTVTLDQAADLGLLYSLLEEHYLKKAVTEDRA